MIPAYVFQPLEKHVERTIRLSLLVLVEVFQYIP